MPNISGLYSALSGMQAHRRVLDNAAHNIANQTTPGYHRRRVDLAPAGIGDGASLFAGTAQKSFGVDVAGVTRIVDEFAEARSLRESAAQAGTATLTQNLDRLELAFREPSESGLAAQLDRFWGGWTDLSNDPGGPAVRTQLLERSNSLVDSIHRAAGDLRAVEEAAKSEVGRLATEVNDLADAIAELNAKIVPGTEGSLDLIDKRGVLIGQLADLTGATTRAGHQGAVDVYIGNRAVVHGTTTSPIEVTNGQAQWSRTGDPVVATSGRLASLKATIEDIVPRYRTALDEVAEQLVTDVNALHTTGYAPDGTTGRNFFDPANITADMISLSADVDGQPSNIAAGAPVLPGPVAPGPLDGELARQMAAIADSATGADSDYRSLVAGLGVEVREAARQDVIQEQVALAARAEADSVSSVSLDEEMAALMAAQRAYEASARVLTVVDDMLGTLIERTGVVGR